MAFSLKKFSGLQRWVLSYARPLDALLPVPRPGSV